MQIRPYFTEDSIVCDEVLNVIAHLPTASLAAVTDQGFFEKLTDANFMRIGVLLARKGV